MLYIVELDVRKVQIAYFENQFYNLDIFYSLEQFQQIKLYE